MIVRIGVDLGGTNIAAGIVNDDGKVLSKTSCPTRAGSFVDDIVRLCKGLAEKISSVGIGCPGTVNPQKGILIYAPHLNGAKNVAVSQQVFRLLNIPVAIENDANCAALGEATYGTAKDSRNSVTITLGTGIGGGIIIDGKIYSGSFFGAGEIGHHVIRANGRACPCGMRGCWEAYASATALVVSARKSGLDHTTAKDVFDAADAGNPTAVRIVKDFYDDLCVGLGNITNMLQPEIVVIGGGLSGRGQSLLDAVNSRIAANIVGGDTKTKFALASLGNDAGIVGAAALFGGA